LARGVGVEDMGQSTDAILFYGYCFEEGAELLAEEFDGDWGEAYARKMGLNRPAEPYPEKNGPGAEEIKAKYAAYWEAKRDLVAKSGAKIGYHCSGDYPIPYVAICASEIRAHRGYEREVASLAVQPEWQAMFDEFCRVMDITPKGEPKWWLVSYWG